MRSGLRAVFALQVALACLLVLSDTASRWSYSLKVQDENPSGPFTPGDQRRTYRQDQTRPEYLLQDAPSSLPTPEIMPDRLEFSMHDVEGLGKVLQVSGGISEGDTVRFRNFVSSLNTKPYLVALNSPGGLVFEALELGRFIREEKFDTAVLSGAACVSSCPYVLSGGVERLVSKGGAVGLHQHYYETPRLLPVYFAVGDIQEGQGKTMEYLIEMGIDPSVMVFALKTPPQQIYLLVEEELELTRVATRILD